VASDKIESRNRGEYFVAHISTIIITVSGRMKHRIARKHFPSQALTNSSLMFVAAPLNLILFYFRM
jgi:hypothetical protein